MMIKKISTVSLSLFLLIFPLWGQKKDTVDEYKLKSAMIRKFFDFIKWPPGTGDASSGKFIFGIVGNTSMGDQVEKLCRQIPIPEKEIIVKTVVDLSQVKECKVLIIGNIEAERLREILTVTGSLPILSISDTEGFCELGVLINFFNADDKVKFEINYAAVKRSGLNFSAKLYKVARLINYPR